MENNKNHDLEEHGLPEVENFDGNHMKNPSLSSQENETASEVIQIDEAVAINHQINHSVYISMPLTCVQTQQQNNISVLCSSDPKTETAFSDDILINSSSQSNTKDSKPPLPTKSYSQPAVPNDSVHPHEVNGVNNFSNHPSFMRSDKRFDTFKTWSGKLEKKFSFLSGSLQTKTVNEEEHISRNTDSPLPVERYYDALEGPELDVPRASEEIVLPQDKKWPFLLRFPVSSFGICLGVSSQAILWKTLATSPSTEFLHISLKINLILWVFSIAIIATIFTTYLLKIILYFEAVRREYYHPIRVNFFFAPWIALLFLALGVPPSLAKNLHYTLWYILMSPLFCIELKIYGQWMSGGQRRLSKVANPSNHLSIVGNFVGALLGASMGLKEGAIFFFAIGLAHYIVLFVTLYQRLPTNETLPKELHPVFFLFVAAPCAASLSWAKIHGSFDNYGSRLAYFVAMFLYFSLAVRVNFFRGFKFSLSWWAYTFPMTVAAVATINYSNLVSNVVTKALCVILGFFSSVAVTTLLIKTILHAFVFQDLFPNDLAIALSERKHKPHKKWFNLRNYGSHDHDHAKQIKNYLRFVVSDKNDLEACAKTIIPSNT